MWNKTERIACCVIVSTLSMGMRDLQVTCRLQASALDSRYQYKIWLLIGDHHLIQHTQNTLSITVVSYQMFQNQ